MRPARSSVSRVAPNRLIGDASRSPEQRFASATWNPYRPDSPLAPSGLLGPVQLLVPREREP
jgi:hypothetical protein